MAFVVDNSIVVAWHFQNQATVESERAFRKLTDHTAHVPALWRQEFSNVLAKAVRKRHIDEIKAFEILARQSALPIVVNESPANIDELLTLALRHQLSSYDASYLELAIRLQLPLATKDDALRAAARSSGIALI